MHCLILSLLLYFTQVMQLYCEPFLYFLIKINTEIYDDGSRMLPLRGVLLLSQ